MSRSAMTDDDPDPLLMGVSTTVIRACDAVLGSICILLALLGAFLLTRGEATVPYVIALWVIPVLNIAWSKVTAGGDRSRADLMRAAVCMPVTFYLYIAGTGMFTHLWTPALCMVAGIGLSLGVATRRAYLGTITSLIYCVPMLIADAVVGIDLDTIQDAVSMMLIGPVLAIVGSKLGRYFDEACRQRDHALREQQRTQDTLARLTLEVEHRMRMEVELRQAQKLEAIGRLAAGVAHEINTPVQYVNDSIQFVREAVRELVVLVDLLAAVNQSVLDGDASQVAARAAVAAAEEADLAYLKANVPSAIDRSIDGLRRVRNIVRSMSVFAHPDAEAMSAIDLNDAIECTLTVAGAEYRHVAELQTDFGELPLVTCHAGEVNQVILSLVVNAAHAIGDEAGADKGRISVRTRADGDHVVVAIADNGRGIPDAIRERVFEPFFTTKDVGHGTGQGLSIARSIIARHHGALTFESRVGIGTTFFIRLPIEPRAALNA
jgi:signal transduction histidine kinase